MNNYPENDYRLYLQHGTKGKTWTWPDHKYLAKTAEGVYLYTKEQLENARKKGVAFVTNASSNLKSTVKDVKGTVNAAKTGGIRGALGYLSDRKKQKQTNRDTIAKTGYADYAASESKEVIANTKKRLKKREKTVKKLTKAYDRNTSLLGRLSNKLRTRLSNLKIKNLKRSFYKITGANSLAGAITAYKARREKRAKQAEAVAKQKERAAKKNALTNQYNETIKGQSSKNKAAKTTIKNQTRKLYRDTGMNPLQYAYSKLEEAYYDDTLRNKLKGGNKNTRQDANSKREEYYNDITKMANKYRQQKSRSEVNESRVQGIIDLLSGSKKNYDDIYDLEFRSYTNKSKKPKTKTTGSPSRLLQEYYNDEKKRGR